MDSDMAGLDDSDYLLKKQIASGHIRPTDPVFNPDDYDDLDLDPESA